MKLSVSYNLFDSEEWLEESVLQVRDYADFISVVFQEISNFGDRCSEHAEPLLDYLLERGLIDIVYLYDPNRDIMKRGRGDMNELIKRSIGLHIGKEKGCTHHMSMDADELYKKHELEYVILEVEKNNYDYCACQMMTYYKEPCYVLDPPEEYYVPLMCQITPDKTFQLGCPFPVEADPTRRMATEKFMAFDRDEIQMHHMSYVRNDIRKKLFNSSSKVNWEARMPELVERWENWKYGDKALLPGKPPVEYNTIKVEGIFSCSR